MERFVKELGVFLATISTAIANFLIFGLAHYRTWSDASEYHAYALNLLEGGIYGFDGVHFDVLREPGYPLFLAALYWIFGNGNLLAVCFVQALLLGVLGYIVYLLFAENGEERVGIFAGIAVSAHPSFGYYANEILTELLFAFLIGIVFYVAHRIIAKNAGVIWYAALGALCGYASLVRVQFLFFLPVILLAILIAKRKELAGTLKKCAVALSTFILIVGAWGTYVSFHTGYFTITEGRQEIALHIRATRAKLSFAEQSQYAFEWVMRSISGGKPYALLDTNEAKGITERYYAKATTSDAVARIKQEDIRTILENPAQYLYGNLIELMKTAYLEHDYTDSQSRYFRPAIYALMYAFFLFGVFQVMWSWKDRRFRVILGLSALFVGYNFLLLSFLDTIPRFNTPYLMFYVIVGFLGVALLMRRHER